MGFFLNRILILNACSFVDGFDNEIIFENMEELKNFFNTTGWYRDLILYFIIEWSVTQNAQ